MVRKNDGYELFAKELCKIILNRNDLFLSDRPDVISSDKSIGIEVTRAIEQDVAKLQGDMSNFKKPINDIHPPKGFYIEENEFFRTTSSSRGFSNKEINAKIDLIKESVKKKIKKSTKYTQATKMGLFIYTESPTSYSDINERIEIFKNIYNSQKNLCEELQVDVKFDFEFIIFFMGDLTEYIIVSQNDILRQQLEEKTCIEINQKVYQEIENNKHK